jgi:hypothetical protein
MIIKNFQQKNIEINYMMKLQQEKDIALKIRMKLIHNYHHHLQFQILIH